MKKYLSIFLIGVVLSFTIIPPQPANATPLFILQVIKAGIVKVIKAVDLKIQRLQNKTIWLQNAQKVLENTLSKLKLQEIAEWSEKQREQYDQYYQELQKVKSLITYYQRVKEIMEKQTRMVKEYSRVWNVLKTDELFSERELDYMGSVYSGILEQTAKNVEQMAIVINSFQTQMSDAERLKVINEIADAVDVNFSNLMLFNRQNIRLRMQRAKSQDEIELVRNMYGLDHE